MTIERNFTPALGRAELTNDYDRVIAVMTRERRWRSALLTEVAPKPGEVVVDVGCGTGTFAIMLAKAQPDACVIAVDPDEAVLEIARRKAECDRVDIDWRQAMGDELEACLGDYVQPRSAPVPDAHEGVDPGEHARCVGRERQAGVGRLRRTTDVPDAPALPSGAAVGRLREHHAERSRSSATAYQRSRLLRSGGVSVPADPDRFDLAFPGSALKGAIRTSRV